MTGKMTRIISSDTEREDRTPPRQHAVKDFPVLHYGSVPEFNKSEWNFRVFGEVDEEWTMGYDDFIALPRVEVMADFHCVTTWSRLDNLWEGVSSREILQRTKLHPSAKFVMIHCEGDFNTNLSLEDFSQEDVLFAFRHDGEDLSLEHGYPLRLVVPGLYAWKSAKWVRALEFMNEDKPGFWERGGYHMHGDPWKEERYSAAH